MSVPVSVSVSVSISVSVFVFVSVSVFISFSVSVFVCVWACVRACVRACACVRVYMYKQTIKISTFHGGWSELTYTCNHDSLNHKLQTLNAEPEQWGEAKLTKPTTKTTSNLTLRPKPQTLNPKL